jgi:hypothetical protein
LDCIHVHSLPLMLDLLGTYDGMNGTVAYDGMD